MNEFESWTDEDYWRAFNEVWSDPRIHTGTLRDAAFTLGLEAERYIEAGAEPARVAQMLVLTTWGWKHQ